MNFDQLGQAWQDENEATTTSSQREQLIATTARRVERFWATIFNRDLRETAAAIFVIVAFGAMQFDPELVPLERIGAAVIVASAVFIVYRLHAARRSPPAPSLDAPLREYCDTELVRVEKQIVLLQTVLGWYVAPILGGLTLMSYGRYGLSRPLLIGLAAYAALALVLHALNQLAVRASLIPLRDKLQQARGRLELTGDDVGPDDAGGSACDALGGMTAQQARLWGIGVFVACLSLGVGGIFYFASTDVEYPKRSPFDAVRWRGDQPEVRIEEEWFRFVSIDGVTLDRIAKFGKWTFGDPRWKKRFEEDLVELLTRMGHEPGETVRLVVSPLDLQEELLLESVSMSEEKRWAIKRSAMTRGRQELPPKYDE